jgi:hypothetical protein
MPNPTASDLHVNGLLGDLSVAYMNSDASFAAAQVFPYVDVQKQTDVYGIYDRGDFLRDGMRRRGPFDIAAQGGYNVTTSDYACEVWSEAILVSDRQRANADDPYRPDEDGAVWLAQQRLIRQEVDWASNFFTTGVWTGSTTSTDLSAGDTGYTAAWNDVSSTPLEDVDAQNDAIEGRTGKRANVLVLNRKGWSALRHHPDIVDRVKGTGGNSNPASVSKQAVAELMELDKIVVTSAVRNTAEEGATTAVSYIAGNHALLAYAASSPGLFEPSGGYIFRWTGLAGQAGGGQGISTYRDDDRKCDRHEIEAAWDCKVAAPLVGAFFQSVA